MDVGSSNNNNNNNNRSDQVDVWGIIMRGTAISRATLCGERGAGSVVDNSLGAQDAVSWGWIKITGIVLEINRLGNGLVYLIYASVTVHLRTYLWNLIIE